jgi:hypothetical protein
MWNFSLKNCKQVLIKNFWIAKIEPYFHTFLKLFFFDFQMHILRIFSWVPINMDFIGFDIWILLPSNQWYQIKLSIQRYKMILCETFFQKTNHSTMHSPYNELVSLCLE